jgi:glycosyltransferase involved in cell wall biosynthesis
VRTWLRHWNMEDAAVLTGTRADVAACISAMDIGVVASLWSEAVARAALEIMACDRPLLGTRVGVMPDLLSEDALVAPGDASALAASLQRLLLDEGLRSTLLRRQQSRMSQLGGREFLRKTLSLYQGLLDS